MPPLPHRRAIAKRQNKEVISVRCPTCNRIHSLHREFGPFCCTSCLQTPIRPLIVNLENHHATR